MFAFARKAAPWAVGLISIVSVWSSAASAEATAEQKRLQHEWWQWVMAIPSSDSPVYDKTGNRCGIGQRGDVWFLAGSTGGKVTRKCTVPQGISLLVPVVNNFCFPDASYTDPACTSDTIAFIDSFTTGTYSLQVNGTEVTPTRVTDMSDFTFTVGSNGFGGVKPGMYRATVADGYWAVVPPLALGANVIRIVAQGPLFSLDVTYNLDVVAPAN
jgi:hypothetical protein